MRHVVVGVEDLPRSRAALEWAARAADQRNAVLRMVHATGLPVAAVDLLGDLLRDEAHELLDRATAVVHEVAPTVEVDLVVEPRRPLHALVEAAEDADLLVVGGRHDGVGDRLRAGSLPYQASAAAGCHVVVVPGPVRHDASGVVVGVDGSMDCVAAVAAAAAEADATRQPLQVLHAWQEPTLYASIDVYPEGLTDQVREEARVALGESVAGLAGRYPDLVVHERLVRGRAARVLVEVGADARLLVVGSRGRNALARLLLGSTSHTVVEHAPCPVMVVHRRHTRVPHN